MVAWNGHGFEVLHGEEAEALHRQEDELAMEIRQFRLWLEYYATPEDAEIIARAEKNYAQVIDQLVQRELELLAQAEL